MALSSFLHYPTSSDFLLNLLLYSSLAILILFYLINHKRKSITKRLPPGPPKLPLLGNLHQLKNPLQKSFQNLSKQYGDLIFLQLGSIPTILISSAEITREIIKNHDIAFSGRPILRAPTRICYDNSDIVFSSYGEHWRDTKKIATLELLSSKRVQSFQAIRKEEVSLLLDAFRQSEGSPINLSKLVIGLTNNVVCRVVFGKKFDGGRDGNEGIYNLLHEIQDLVGSICVSDFFPWMWWLNKLNGFDARLEKNFAELDRLFEDVIKEHADPKRPKPEYEDLVDVLLRLQQDSKKMAEARDGFKGFLTDMFVAGTDTSAAVIEWTMAELIKNPMIMTKAIAEVRQNIRNKDKVEEDDLSPLIYLKMVIKETMRLHPPGPFLIPRETMEGCKIRGYEIPPKTRVFINASSISVDPKSWENPYDFRPERFLNSSVDFRGQHFEFIPFGVGRRICPGINFASVLIELVVANLLYHFDWELPHNVTRDNIDMEGSVGLSVHKKTPLWLVPTLAN